MTDTTTSPIAAARFAEACTKLADQFQRGLITPDEYYGEIAYEIVRCDQASEQQRPTPKFDKLVARTSPFTRKRVQLIVEVDLDPVPGWGNEARDYQRLIQGQLDSAIPHYNPDVRIVTPTTTKEN